MGQGVNTKILQVAAQVFSIQPGKVHIKATSTHKIANTSPSAASSTADLNGIATMMACTAIKERLLKVASEALNEDVSSIEIKNEKLYVNGVDTDWDWQRLVMAAFLKRVSLSEHAHYA